MPIHPPNILFIMADDHACQAMSCYGSAVNETPSLDRLAREGRRFGRCFDVNALCAPSRATILTGTYSHANGFLRNRDRFDGSQVTFPKLLQGAGYETAIIGKWHLVTEPTGFDYYNVLPGQGQYWDSAFKEKGEPWVDGPAGGIDQQGYVTDVITDRSMQWLANRDADKPFCLMVHHKSPHTPHDYPERYGALFADGDLPEPATLADDYATRPVLAACDSAHSRLDRLTPEICGRWGWDDPRGPSRLAGSALRKWAYQRFFKGYLRLVASLDDNVGRLLDFLDDQGLRDNTIVVYTSDNGFFLGDHGLYNKQWMYEEAQRIPLIVRYPNHVPAGTVNDHLVATIDFAPTFLDYAGAEVPETMQGQSMRPLLEGHSPADWRQALYYHYYGQFGVESHTGIRTERHKLMHFYDHKPAPVWECFDLKEDPDELNNVYNAPDQAETVMHLKQELHALQATLGDDQPGRTNER